MSTHAHSFFHSIRFKTMLLFALLLTVVCQNNAWAEISLNVTRVIFDQKTKEANVRIMNEGEYPVLIQNWIDRGNTETPPEELEVPFIMTPAFFRLDNQAVQHLRILYTGLNTLPTDKESIFWLNVQEVPPMPQAEKDTNYMQIAFRTRIKIFYRPTSIPFNTERLHQQLTFKVTEENGRSILQIDNPTPIHITFLKINMGANLQEPIYTFEPEDSMVEPYGTLNIPFESPVPSPQENTPVHYIFLDDFGVPTEYKTRLTNQNHP